MVSTHYDSEQPLLNGLSAHGNSRASYGATGSSVSSEHDDVKQDLLKYALYPKDSYDGKVYWADLPYKERHAFNRFQYKVEAQREIKEIKDMARENWLSPIRYYMQNYAISGVGFLTEGYVLFSIGNILPLFKSTYPDCWKTFSVCDQQVIKSIKYMEIVGVSQSYIVTNIC